MTMRMRPTEYPHIFWNEAKGLPCIAGTRLRVQDVVGHHQAGRTAEQIQEDFPSYTLAEIFSALAYYYDHQDEMDRAIDERERRAAEAMAEIEARHGPSPLREKLRSLGLRLVQPVRQDSPGTGGSWRLPCTTAMICTRSRSGW